MGVNCRLESFRNAALKILLEMMNSCKNFLIKTPNLLLSLSKLIFHDFANKEGEMVFLLPKPTSVRNKLVFYVSIKHFQLVIEKD